MARAPALQAGGRRFDSDYLHQEDLINRSGLFYCIDRIKNDNVADVFLLKQVVYSIVKMIIFAKNALMCILCFFVYGLRLFS